MFPLLETFVIKCLTLNVDLDIREIFVKCTCIIIYMEGNVGQQRNTAVDADKYWSTSSGYLWTWVMESM